MNDRLSSFTCRIAISTLFVFGAALSIAAWNQAAPDAQQQAAAILTAAAQAAGGDALAKVNGMELTTRRLAFLSGHGQGQSEADTRVLYPAQMRLVVKVMESQVVGGGGGLAGGRSGGPVTPISVSEYAGFAYIEGCDGTAWWRKVAQKQVDVLPMNKGTQRRIELLGGLGIHRLAADGKLSAKFVGEQQVQGHQVQVVVLDDGYLKLYFDPQTHLLAGASLAGILAGETFDAFHWWTDFVKVTVQGTGREQTIWWSDYRRVKFKVDGKEEAIQFPYFWTNDIDGTKFLEEKVNNVKLNTKQNPKIFEKPK